MQARRYSVIAQAYSSNAEVGGNECAGIEFINNGTGIVRVGPLILYPGNSWQPVQALPNEADATLYLVIFEAGATLNNLVVTRKFYID